MPQHKKACQWACHQPLLTVRPVPCAEPFLTMPPTLVLAGFFVYNCTLATGLCLYSVLALLVALLHSPFHHLFQSHFSLAGGTLHAWATMQIRLTNILYSLWSKILAMLFSTHKIFHREFQNWKKLHRPFLYIERVLSVYTLNV